MTFDGNLEFFRKINNKAGLENSYIRSVSYSNQNILIGTAQSEVLILNNQNNEAGEISWVTRGHAEGQGSPD